MTNYNFQQLEAIWQSAGGNVLAAPMAAAIALAESGGNPSSVNNNGNGTTDRGLWQINSIHGAQSTFDVMANARAAVAISNNGTNWRPWCTAWSNGRCGGTFLGTGSPYQKHLPSGPPAPGSTAGSSTSPTNPNPPPDPRPPDTGALASGVGAVQGAISSVSGLGDLSGTLAQIYNSFTKTLWFGAITILGILMMFGGLAILGIATKPGQQAMSMAKKAL